MPDYIFMLESRLSPEQLKALNRVQQAAQDAGMNVYLVGGAVRDLMTGSPPRVEGTEGRQGAELVLADGVRLSLEAARNEFFHQPGKPPEVRPASVMEDLRRRDFSINAMGISLTAGGRRGWVPPPGGARPGSGPHRAQRKRCRRAQGARRARAAGGLPPAAAEAQARLRRPGQVAEVPPPGRRGRLPLRAPPRPPPLPAPAPERRGAETPAAQPGVEERPDQAGSGPGARGQENPEIAGAAADGGPAAGLPPAPPPPPRAAGLHPRRVQRQAEESP